ncbi:PREDICTED: uncharacterized protein LOC104739317 [Camelina sativa]|uniref:Uncharacterized protein LOC104739317 n=1 Tax=Camelina sativa TaxID=90675 RepID=A0ABM0VLA5_CAMSA|nr:PREDICTED: uncharacterized protein LOC104739317 [Camelina sativa]
MAMATLDQLHYNLLRKPEQEKITPEELSVINSCYLKALWTAGFASGVVGGLTWLVTKKLIAGRVFERRCLAGGVACGSFPTTWDRASSKVAVTYLDRILSQEYGTRMQKELANVLVRYNEGEAWRWQLMSKHFYTEAVYGDEGGKPQMRWRSRTTFTEIVASSYNDTKSQKNHSGLPNRGGISNGFDASKTKPMLQNSRDGEMVEEDALDIVFGGPEPTESSIPAAPVISSKGSGGKTQTRKQKRAQRRQET